MISAKRLNHFSLSAFCGVGGAKWGEGRGEVLVHHHQVHEHGASFSYFAFKPADLLNGN
jgi:hypothetical protein